MAVDDEDSQQLSSERIVFRVMLEISIIQQLGASAFERVMPQGMTMAQFGILSHFTRRPLPQRPADLAAAFQVSRATMTSTLQKLEVKGLIMLVADAQDKRAKRVTLSEEGRQMHEACIARLSPELTEILKRLDRSIWEGLLEPLMDIRRTLDAMRDEP